jgi:hypothetical protein
MERKMLKKTELEIWWDRLDPKTKEYLKSQPLWHDRDLYKALATGILIGLIVGIVVGFELAAPDFSQQPVTYIKG